MSINTTLNNCANITGNAWSQGEHTLTVWANDSANNQNSASITFTIEDSNPRINLISPTPNNNTFTTNQNIIINTSIIDQNINNIIYNWQGTNYTIYNDSLVLMLNFDNISSLGENSTSIIDFAKQNNGTAIGGANYNSSGRYGGCYNFDGTDDYIQIADNSNLDVNTITLSAWVNLASWDEGGSIITKGTGGGGEVWSLDVTGNKYRFYFWKSGTPYVLDSLTTPSGWQHITATYDGTEMEFYINGNLTNSNTVSQGNLDNNDHIISIGSRQSGSGSYDLNVNGQIDEIRIWDSGLNESEVYQQYISNLNRYNSSQWYLYINQSKNTTNLLDEGTYTYNVFAIDRSNNQNKTNIQTITIDTTFPQITISSPTNNTFSNNANLNINYTIVETNIDSCWYSNDSMSKNTTLTNCANITDITWSEGQHNVTIWTNDSVNQVNKTSTSFNIDSNTPLISITSPNNNTFSNNANLNINYTIVETNIDSCWYSNDSMSKNTTLTNCANITDITWSEGQHNVTIWTNDSSNRINRTSVTFSIDTIFPQITITSPTNNSNLTNYNTKINYTIVETNIDSCWYSNDSMSKNTTLTNCANITTIIWNIGQHNVTIWTNDSVNQVNKSSITFTILEDKDQDGTEDINDSLEYNETYVIKEGITKLNITVGGNSTNNTYTEKHEVRFYDQNTLLLNFSHNFSQSEIDLSKVRITKTSTALIVNFSGQLQENKTLFIPDNDFVSLCVKDQEISSVSEISSSCTGANETDFTSCLGSQTRINSINCTDLGDTIKVENLQHSGILGTQATPVESPPSSSSGGSGGGGSNSISTAYGSDNETEEKECYSNADCSSDYHCYENECVKLFDIKILNASVIDGHLHFTYFVKGMAVFNNDITIKFWLTKDGMNYTEGQDVIYLGEYEEKTETTKLYLPSELEKGTYKFYIETSFEDYSATSYRTLELEKEGEEFIATLAPETTLTSDWINLIIVVLLTLFIITITRLTNPKDWIINKIKQIKIPKIKISKIKVPKTKKAPIKVKVKPKTEKNALVKGLLKEILKPKTEEPNLTKALLKEILKKK